VPIDRAISLSICGEDDYPTTTMRRLITAPLRVGLTKVMSYRFQISDTQREIYIVAVWNIRDLHAGLQTS
jgi:hypothetical protein